MNEEFFNPHLLPNYFQHGIIILYPLSVEYSLRLDSELLVGIDEREIKLSFKAQYE